MDEKTFITVKVKQSKQTHTQKDKNNDSATTWSIQNHLHVKRAASQFTHFQQSSVNFSGSWFVIRINFFHPKTSLLLDGLLLSHWCFPILKNYHFQVSFNLKVTSYFAKIKNTVFFWSSLRRELVETELSYLFLIDVKCKFFCLPS